MLSGSTDDDHQEEKPGGQSTAAEKPGGQSIAAEKPTAQSTPPEKPSSQSTPPEKPSSQSTPPEKPSSQSTSEKPGGSQSTEKSKGSSSIGVGSWLKSQAAAWEANVKEFADNVQTVHKEVQKTIALPTTSTKPRKVCEERFEVVFQEKSLGAEFDLRGGAVVIALKPGGQAERLQVQLNDRLVAIHGEQLPPPDESEHFVETVRDRLSTMGRPVPMAFVRETAGDKMSKAEMEKELSAAREQVQRLEQSWDGLKEEARVAREDATAANKDAIEAVQEAAQLRADLADLQLSKVFASDEIRKGQEEVEKAQAEVAGLQLKLQREKDRCIQIGSEHADAMQLAEDNEGRAAEHAAKASKLEAAIQEMEAGAQALRKENAVLASKVSEATKPLEEELRQKEQALKLQADEATSAKDWAEEAELRMQRVHEDCEEKQAALAVAESTVSELTKEREELSEALERRKIASSSSETRINDLKREVERLRVQVGRYEVLQDWVTERESLYEEIHCVRLEARKQEERAAQLIKLVPQDALEECNAEQAATILDLQAEGQSPEEVEADGQDEKQPLLTSAEEAGSTVKAPKLRGEDGDNLSSDVADLKAQISVLLEEREQLDKQLKARPIIYQFGSTPLPAVEQYDVDEDVDEAEVPKPSVAEGVNMRCVGLLLLSFLCQAKRRLGRVAGKLRRQPCTQMMEGSLRKFTRNLLDRPLLMWVFYAHIIVLWLLEFSRQAAVSKSMTASDQLQKDFGKR